MAAGRQAGERASYWATTAQSNVYESPYTQCQVDIVGAWATGLTPAPSSVYESHYYYTLALFKR